MSMGGLVSRKCSKPDEGIGPPYPFLLRGQFFSRIELFLLEVFLGNPQRGYPPIAILAPHIRTPDIKNIYLNVWIYRHFYLPLIHKPPIQC